tara:strand:+ start:231 stop:758 length:528 start_codon:yes stop_codon:yes gene_type:complete
MSNVILKPILESSVEDLATIHVQGWQAGYKDLVPDDYLENLSVDEYKSKWQLWLKELAQGYVAEVDGIAAGFVSFGKIRTRLPCDKGVIPLYSGEIYALYLKPDYWRMGLGSQLLRAAFEDLKQERHNGAALWVVKDNKRACSFYEAHGGQRVAKKKQEIGGRFLNESAFGWRTL